MTASYKSFITITFITRDYYFDAFDLRFKHLYSYILNLMFSVFFTCERILFGTTLSIGNLKQSFSSERNATKPEFQLIFSKGRVLGSQSEVNVNVPFLTIRKLRVNQSYRQQGN